jgi:uncharacterized damage-inducible protein DinB
MIWLARSRHPSFGRGRSMPASLVGTFAAMARNNAWANHRLLAACSDLTQEEFEAPRISFFPSLKLTLNHILTVDWFYVDGLEGGWLGPNAWADPTPCATLKDLRREQAAIDRRLIAVCDALTPETLNSTVRLNRATRIQTERRDRLLLHLFQHQIHHRGQAHAMLAGTRVNPPQLDEFYSSGEAPLRAVEFLQLGWTEELVWGKD